MSARKLGPEGPPSSGELVSRRLACALLALSPLSIGAKASADGAPTANELAERFGLKRRAYQSGDAELLRGFYDDDIVIVGEGLAPLLGLDAVIGAYRALLPKRRDIEVQPLRLTVAPGGAVAYEFVRFTAFARDPEEKLPIVTFLFIWQRRAVGWRCTVELLLRQDLSLTPGFPTYVPSSASR